MNKPNDSLSLEDLRRQIDVVRSETASFSEKKAAEVRLKAHFWVKFEQDEYADSLFTKLVGAKDENRFEQIIYGDFKKDFDKVILESVGVFLENIKKENFKNTEPEAYFKTILTNKLSTEYRKRGAAMDKEGKEAIKKAAKKQPTIKDFYKNYNPFLFIIRAKNKSQETIYQEYLFEDFLPTEMGKIEKAIEPFKNIENIDLIWETIQKENHRCFYEQKCLVCVSAETCLKHQIMIKNKEGGIPYQELIKETPFKSIRELISRRMKQLKKSYEKN